MPHTHKVYLWAHLNFNIEFNGDQVSSYLHRNHKCQVSCLYSDECAFNIFFQIISANVSTANHQPVALDDIELPYNVEFTYSVLWSSTE